MATVTVVTPPPAAATIAMKRCSIARTGLPSSQCSHPACTKTTDLHRCSACHSVVYCGRDHQAADRPRHKSACTLVKKHAAAYQAQTSALHTSSSPTTLTSHETMGFTINALSHLFTTLAGAVPRSYLQARLDLIAAFLSVGTVEAVENALAHASGLLHLDRRDPGGVRGLVAALLLRLGRDQDTYDYVKWWATASTRAVCTGESALHLCGDPDAVHFVDMEPQDPTEDLDEPALRRLRADKPALPAMLVLLKVRLLLDLARWNEYSAQLGARPTPEDRIEWAKREAASDVLLSETGLGRRRDAIDDEALQSRLQAQIQSLVRAVHQRNSYYWSLLQNPPQHDLESPAVYTLGSEEEAAVAFRETWPSWNENPEALEYVKLLTGDCAVTSG